MQCSNDSIGKSACLAGISRFNNIDATSKPVLFVRTVPTTQELKVVPERLGDKKASCWENKKYRQYHT